MSKSKKKKVADKEQHKEKMREKKMLEKKRKKTSLPARHTKGKR